MSDMSAVNNDYLYCLFMGEPGTRKSTAALSFPKPIYFFDYDKKMGALRIPMNKWKISNKDVQFDSYTDWNKAEAKLKQLQLNCPFRTIVLDTITSMGDSVNDQTLNVKYGTTTASGAEAGKRIGGIAVNTIEDFNAETSAFQKFLKLTKDIHLYHKVNIILIAHVIQTEYKSPDNKSHMSRSIVTGVKKLAKKIPSVCGEIYYFYIDGGFEVGADGKYCLYTQHSGDDFARSSLPLPAKIQIADDSLYDRYVLPAIKKQQEETKAHENMTKQQQPTPANDNSQQRSGFEGV